MSLVSYQLEGSVATVTLDDGKANVLSLAMQADLNAALDRAEADGSVVVLAGRPGILSGGFDLAVLTGGGQDSFDMLFGGFELSYRLLSFPTPVVIACTGHAVAMGLFLLLSGDHRIGVDGPCKLIANEVAIGMTLPWAAVEMCRQRLTPAAFNRVVNLSEQFTGDAAAVEAGILDELAPADQVVAAAQAKAVQLAGLNLRAHTATKLRARKAALEAIRAGIEADDAELRPFL